MGPLSDPYSITGQATLDTGLNPQFLLTADGQQVDMNAIGASGEGAKRSRSEQVADGGAAAGNIPVASG